MVCVSYSRRTAGIGACLRLYDRGILLESEVVDRLNDLANPDNLEEILAEIPPALHEPLKACPLKAYGASSLPPITSVDVVSLRGIPSNQVSDYMLEARDSPGVRLTGEAAQAIASLWRRLPPRTQMRCHIPPYGLRFRSEETVILQASICWKCNNIFGTFGIESFIPIRRCSDRISAVAHGDSANPRR